MSTLAYIGVGASYIILAAMILFVAGLLLAMITDSGRDWWGPVCIVIAVLVCYCIGWATT